MAANRWQGKEESVKRTRVLAFIAGAVTVAAIVALTSQAGAAKPPASSDSQTDQYIVQFKPGADRGGALRSLGARFGVTLTEERQLAVGSHVVKVHGKANGLLTALNARSDVEYAEVDLRMYALSTPNDPLFPDQWHYYEATAGLNLPGAWDLATGSGVKVAVLD